MTGGDWATLVVGVAALLVALAAVPSDAPNRRRLVVMASCLVVVAVAVGVVTNQAAWPARLSGVGEDVPVTAEPAGSGEQDGVRAGRKGGDAGTSSDLGTVAVATRNGAGARLHFGTLGALVSGLAGEVVFRVDPERLAREAERCAETVVFSGAAGQHVVVYAEGLGTGWGALEHPPGTTPQGAEDVVHQQIVTPPADAVAGEKWSAGASLVADGSTVDTAAGTVITLVDAANGRTTWDVAGERVSCAR
ncbi:hypothetical protein GCM10009613_45950 [Pseudonocardia kongjuensis]|uniref:Uncharacterized protein n=1 Tax=Pseudonocardia kongjuensis TaxID=102227 RepID=A0ABN1Y218_9PSEU